MVASVSERIHAYFPALLKRAGKWCNDPEESYDLAVDTMIYSLERVDKFRAGGGFYTWLIWNMRAVVSARRYGQMIGVEFDESYVKPVGATQEYATDLSILYDRMGPTMREVYIEGKTVAEIAREQKMSNQAISWRLNRERSRCGI